MVLSNILLLTFIIYLKPAFFFFFNLLSCSVFVFVFFFLTCYFIKSWADLVKSEIGSAVIWEKDWGELYKPNAPIGYDDRIALLKSQLKT